MREDTGDAVTASDDELCFLPESDERTETGEKWKVLIVDDDHEVHAVTTLVLSTVVFEGRGLAFLHAYSGEEGCRMLAAHPDIAVVFMDVIMETEQAGLEAIRHIRETLGNKWVRLVLRTGQPGQSPEERVIVDYDINDYKAKSELTSSKLFTTLISALRSYRDLKTIEANRQGLRKIVVSSASLFELDSIHMFVSGVLMQLTALFGVPRSGILVARQGDVAGGNAGDVYLLAATGDHESEIGCPARQVLTQEVVARIERVLGSQRSSIGPDHCAIFIPVPKGRPVIGYVELPRNGTHAVDTDLLEVFCLNVGIAFDNFRLFEQLNQTQEAAVLALGKLAEYHDDFTGDHLARVERLAREVATRLFHRGAFADCIDSRYLEYFGIASALHDVGKVGVPSEILTKPGPLNDAEIALMRRHTLIGHDILHAAARKINVATYLDLAAEIALTHHERYDGLGYPQGLAGQDIPISGRIVAAVDVYDALGYPRPYKKAWSQEEALDYVVKGAGTLFDPMVVEVLQEVLVTGQAPA